MQAADTTTLFKYLRQLGISANPQARADIMGKIADDELKAYRVIKPKPAPIRSGLAAMANYFESGASEPRLVPAMSVPEVRAEIEKAAMSEAADWNLLNRLLIDAPAECSKEQPEPKTPERHAYKYEKHLKLILDALRDEGFDPKALPPREDGKRTPKAVVRTTLVEPKGSLTKSQFKHGWEYGRSIQEINEVAFVTT